MTSLFSSFDLMIFYNIYMFFLFFIMLKFIYPFNMSNMMNYKFFLGMNNFFNSLNNSNFSKMMSSFVMSMIIFIFTLNISSIFPYNFALSSQMSVVLGLSLFSWFCIVSFSMFKNYKMQIGHLIPEGSPFILSPFLYVIELISNLIRPLTLTVRLVANILAGHLLVILLSSLVENFNFTFPFLSFLNLVEMLVSFIQSYIFVTLISLYYSEI